MLNFALPAMADSEKRILISYDKSRPYHARLASTLKEKISSDIYKISETGSDDTSSERKEFNLIITIGYNAASSVINQQNTTPVFSLLIPQQAHTSLLNERIKNNSQQLYSALYIDQPLRRQIRLIKSLSNQFKTIAVLLGQHSYNQKDVIASTINKMNQRHVIAIIDDQNDLIRKTRNVIAEADILLAIPDNTVYNRRTIQSILLTTYRRKTPVIGFSEAYVKAGALAAVYSTDDDFSSQAKKIIPGLLSGKYQGIRLYPEFFNVIINNKVAHSLGLSTFSQKDILEKLYMDEKK